MNKRRLLIIGAAEPTSLGAWCEKLAWINSDWDSSDVVTAGVSGAEDIALDITSEWQLHQLLENEPYTDIICTAGVNVPTPIYSLEVDFPEALNYCLYTNAFGPILTFEVWFRTWKQRWEQWSSVQRQDWHREVESLNFVAVSSNSAHIARSGSTGYCMSKAALSMGIRCIARACAEEPVNVWGYEPGFIAGTPMSREAVERYGEAPHRIPGNRISPVGSLAQMIVKQVANDGKWLNGSLIRTDGGEQ